MSADLRDELPAAEYQMRSREVHWRGADCCGSKGPHRATCVRYPGHLGRWCEGAGNPDEWGPKDYAWENERHADPNP